MGSSLALQQDIAVQDLTPGLRTYRPKVLIVFKNLRHILSVEEESILAKEICAVIATSADAYLDGAGINPVIQSLRKKSMNSLAQKLWTECGTK
jgi:hypothetical protein